MRNLAIASIATVLLAGCAYQGGDMGDPLNRKVGWFSYVGGDDIRAQCQPGTPDRFRLVYNGVYERQLRMYELDSLRHVLSVKVTRPGNVARLSSDDLLAPWRAVDQKVQLDASSYDKLVADMDKAGMFGPPAVGRELPSHGYHWSAAACKGGQFHFTGWVWPDAGFETLPFAADLFGLDPTGIAVAQPGPIPFDPQYDAKARRGEVSEFKLKVGRDGLVR